MVRSTWAAGIHSGLHSPKAPLERTFSRANNTARTALEFTLEKA